MRLMKRKAPRESNTTSAFCFRGWRHIPSAKSSPSIVTLMISFSTSTTETSASSAKMIRSEFTACVRKAGATQCRIVHEIIIKSV